MPQVRHYQHHYHFSYVTSFKRHSSLFLVVTLVLTVLSSTAFHFLAPSQPILEANQISPFWLLYATFNTLSRLTIAYAIALVLSVPLALLITGNPKFERILLPFFDILQSVPVLAFFPIIVLVFIRLSLFSGAAIFILGMAMLWNLVFSQIGGIKTIPQDITDAATVFKVRGVKKIWSITIPAILPYIITGSLLAWGQGWNILIVAEVLHNYIPHGSESQDLVGLGSLLVHSSYSGNSSVFIATLFVMILLIAVMNFFIWQKLLHLAQRYKFD